MNVCSFWWHKDAYGGAKNTGFDGRPQGKACKEKESSDLLT